MHFLVVNTTLNLETRSFVRKKCLRTEILGTNNLYTYMNTVDLYLIHFVFIVACVFFSYRSGQKSGRSEMVTDLLDRNMLTVEKLKKEYEIR